MTAAEIRYRSKPRTKALAVARSRRYLERHEHARLAKRAADRNYGQTQNGKAVRNRAASVYRKTERGRIVRRIGKARRRNAIGSHTPEEWQAQLLRFGNACAKCKSTDRIEEDHIISIANGGTNFIENIQPLCRRCNASKGAR